MRENILQLIKFTTVGCVNTFIDWSVYFVIVRMFPEQSIIFYTFAKGFSYLCGMINSFLLNRCWTFKVGSVDGEGGRFMKFVLVNALGLSINSGSVYMFLHLNLSHLQAIILATAITFSFNFTLSKFWVFRKGLLAKTSGG